MARSLPAMSGAEPAQVSVSEQDRASDGEQTVDSLEDGAGIANVGRGGKTKTADETGAHVGDDITVEIRHDQNHGLVVGGVGNHLFQRLVTSSRICPENPIPSDKCYPGARRRIGH